MSNQKMIIIASCIALGMFFFIFKGSNEEQIFTGENSTPTQEVFSDKVVKEKEMKKPLNENTKNSAKNNQMLEEKIGIVSEIFQQSENKKNEKLVISQKESSKFFQNKVEENWKKGAHDFFIDRLKLTEETFSDYREIRAEYKNDRKIHYDQYIQNLIDKYGVDYKKNPDAVHEIFINENYVEYQEALAALMGSDNLQLYFNYKNDFNESIEELVADDEEFYMEY